MLYRDESHLTNTAATRIVPYARQMLADLGGFTGDD